LTAKAVSSSEIDLEWDNNSNSETGYIIFRNTTDDFSSATNIGTSPADQPVYNDTTVQCNTTYYYWVIAATAAAPAGMTAGDVLAEVGAATPSTTQPGTQPASATTQPTTAIVNQGNVANLGQNASFTLPDGSTGTVSVWTDGSVKNGQNVLNGDVDVQFKDNNPADVQNAHWVQYISDNLSNAAGPVSSPYFILNLTILRHSNKTYLDSSVANDPYYDDVGLNIRSATSLDIFDNPSITPATGATNEDFVADDYLFVGGKAVYHVHWERTGDLTANPIVPQYAAVTAATMDPSQPFVEPAIIIGQDTATDSLNPIIRTTAPGD
jgi:hypothetical protein